MPDRRVLFIAYLFPPIANSGTQRPLKFAKYLPGYGWQPHVLTAARIADYPQDPGLLAEVPASVKVVRVPMLNDRIGAVAGTLGLGMVKPETISEGISWRLRSRWQHPDLYALWRPTARRAALKLWREEGFDAIYATGYPWTSLLVGMDVAAATGRPFVADFRDPWSADDYEGRSLEGRDADLRLEREVVSAAAAVVGVSSTMTRELMAAHPMVRQDKFVTIPNGFDPADLGNIAPWPRQRFRIVYTGVWKTGYGPTALYDAIAALLHRDPHLLSNVEVLAAGFEPGPAHRRGLSEYIDEIGLLSHHDAVALMRSADVLFLQNAEGASQRHRLPGKIFEYLATGRPLIAVTDPEGEAGSLVRRVGGGVVVGPDDHDGLRRVLADAIRRRALETPPRDAALLRAFERPALAKVLASILDAITHRQAVA
jgi:glycosyltransferase involved in cell wall biosynthesis